VYDSATYAQYLQADWKNLVKTSRNALKENYDYYYLRMRRGIALYEQQKYLAALKNFKKASDFNFPDPVSSEYIYYSYLFSGQRHEALLHWKNNAQLLSPNIADPKRDISNFFIDLAGFRNQNLYTNNISVSPDILGITGYQTITNNFFAGDFLLSHDLSHQVSLTHGGSFLLKSSYYYNQTSSQTYDATVDGVKQYQYFARLGINPGNGFLISASGHYVYLYNPGINYRERIFGSAYIIPADGQGSRLGRLSLSKNFWRINAAAGISTSTFNLANQFQADARLTFFPEGNLNLYVSTEGLLTKETFDYLPKNERVAFRHTLGFKVLNYLWMETALFHGEIRNMNFNDGFLIFNGPETTDLRGDVNLIIPAKKFTLSLRSSISHFRNDFMVNNYPVKGLNTQELRGGMMVLGLQWKY
jgi:hypothetical protein